MYQISDEKRQVAHFQPQPVGPGPFFRPASLSLTYVCSIHHAHSSYLGKKLPPAVMIQLVLTGPSNVTSMPSAWWSSQPGVVSYTAPTLKCL